MMWRCCCCAREIAHALLHALLAAHSCDAPHAYRCCRVGECALVWRRAEKISKEVAGAEVAKGWSASVVRALLELVASNKGVTEDADVCLLREVKLKFKAAGMSKIGAREKTVAAMQLFLTPKAKPKSEDRSFIAKEFLKAAQAGALVDMTRMLTAHPSVLSARSSSKGYSAMHYAAMAGALSVLDWLAANGLSPEALSSPSDGSPPLTPAQVAEEYKRDLGAPPLPPPLQPRRDEHTRMHARRHVRTQARSHAGTFARRHVRTRVASPDVQPLPIGPLPLMWCACCWCAADVLLVCC